MTKINMGHSSTDNNTTQDKQDEDATTPILTPLEVALDDMPQVSVNEAGAVRLKNGNPGQVISADCEYGDEAWASHKGKPVAIGIYKAGELHPSRVFNL